MTTQYIKNKENKKKTIYELHDEIGCIRKFKEKELALNWKANRKELKLIIIKPKKEVINFKEIEEAIF